ncbi:MAG: MAPEG family protein [Candidatus Margulisiibacteriota bacterium]
MFVPLTSLFAGIMTLFYVRLTLRVVGFRKTYKVLLGDGGHDVLKAAISGHANFAQYAPLGVLLSFLCEIQGVSPYFMGPLIILFMAGRVIHYIALTNFTLKDPIRIRRLGMRLTLMPLILFAVFLIFLSVYRVV